MVDKNNDTLHLNGELHGDEAALQLGQFIEPDVPQFATRTLTIDGTPYEQYSPMALLDAPTEAITARVCAFCVARRPGSEQPHAVIVSFEATEAPIAETLQVRELED